MTDIDPKSWGDGYRSGYAQALEDAAHIVGTHNLKPGFTLAISWDRLAASLAARIRALMPKGGER